MCPPPPFRARCVCAPLCSAFPHTATQGYKSRPVAVLAVLMESWRDPAVASYGPLCVVGAADRVPPMTVVRGGSEPGTWFRCAKKQAHGGPLLLRAAAVYPTAIGFFQNPRRFGPSLAICDSKDSQQLIAG